MNRSRIILSPTNNKRNKRILTSHLFAFPFFFIFSPSRLILLFFFCSFQQPNDTFLQHEQIKDYLVRETGDKYAIANVTKEDLKKNNDKDVSFDFDAVEPMTTEGVMSS